MTEYSKVKLYILSINEKLMFTNYLHIIFIIAKPSYNLIHYSPELKYM